MKIRWVPLPRHTAQFDEIMEVRWSDYYGAAVLGDDGEIARLPHKRCRLEVLATARSSHEEVDRILPGQVVRYKGSSYFLDRFELPSGTAVGLWHLVGFKLRVLANAITSVPSENADINADQWRTRAAMNFLVVVRIHVGAPSASQRCEGACSP